MKISELIKLLEARKKQFGNPYQCTNEAWGINYFSLEKVVE